jgi:hypothetical protein
MFQAGLRALRKPLVLEGWIAIDTRAAAKRPGCGAQHSHDALSWQFHSGL